MMSVVYGMLLAMTFVVLDSSQDTALSPIAS